MTDDSLSRRAMPAAGDDEKRAPFVEADSHGRLPPGSLPGWGLSWWLHEHGLLASWEQLSMSTRLERTNDYWRAVSEGWWPSVPREKWVGSYHPWEPAT